MKKVIIILVLVFMTSVSYAKNCCEKWRYGAWTNEGIIQCIPKIYYCPECGTKLDEIQNHEEIMYWSTDDERYKAGYKDGLVEGLSMLIENVSRPRKEHTMTDRELELLKCIKKLLPDKAKKLKEDLENIDKKLTPIDDISTPAK